MSNNFEIKIFEREGKIYFNYNKTDQLINFDNLVNFSKFLLQNENFKNLKIDELNIQAEVKHSLYKKTLEDILTGLQDDEDLLTLLKE